jgi:hypothetical protein
MNEQVPEKLRRMVASSAYCISLDPGADGIDMKIAVETGLMVLLDKPIMVIVRAGVPPLPGLLRHADVVVELSGPIDSLEGQAQIQAGLAKLNELFPNEEKEPLG